MGVHLPQTERMNLLKSLKRLNMDALEKALSNLNTPELLGLAKPIASTPFSLRGEDTQSIYLMICDELEHRNPAEWVVIEAEFQRREKTSSRMDTFIAPFRKTPILKP